MASGNLTQIWRGVIVRTTDLLDLRTRAEAAVLVVGDHAVVSGSTAVALHGYSAAGDTAVHLTVPYQRSARSRPGLVLHQNRFRAEDVMRIDGLPVFARDHAIADFLCDGGKRPAFAAMDQALSALDPGQRDEFRALVLARLDGRDDPRGIARARMLTDLATGQADSPPESWFRLLLVERGFPIPDAQFQVFTIDGRVLYVLDMAWPSARIAFEYDGYAAHENRKNYDRVRDERLSAMGWIVIRADVDDLRDPERVVAELRAAFTKRGHTLTCVRAL